LQRRPHNGRAQSFNEETMADKLNTGDAFPKLTLKLVGGGTATLPLPDARYQMILFYRGHW
jgi:hypothetical protein